MENKEYEMIVKKYTKREEKIKNIILAFISGGIMGLIGNGLVNLYKNVFNLSSSTSSVLMIITLIFITCLLTAIGVFDSLVNIFRMGLIIPISGFAHATQSAALDYKEEGLVTGIGMNMLKLSGSVIIYGVVGAFFIGFIRYLIGVI